MRKCDKEIKKNGIYIVGAHSRAQTVGHYLQYLNPDVRIVAYLVDNDEPNLVEIMGIPVIHFDENTKLHTDYPVYLGTRGVYHQKLILKLKKCGMKNIIPVDVQLDLNLRNQYLRKYYQEIKHPYLKLEEMDVLTEMRKEPIRTNMSESGKILKSKAAIYVANSVSDKPLRENYELATYERLIQVGAALTDKRIAPNVLTDATGDNISEKNEQFCELTGLYWIWKHAEEEVVGLVHYRRHFIIPEDWLIRMNVYRIDVILPLPLYVAPNLEGNFKSRHDPTDWDYMYSYLKENLPEDYNMASRFFKETDLYCPCNMFIMKKFVLNELCEWLFPILFACAENGGTKVDGYRNRYPGFISERLITYFFEKNREKYKIVYADKNFLT